MDIDDNFCFGFLGWVFLYTCTCIYNVGKVTVVLYILVFIMLLT